MKNACAGIYFGILMIHNPKTVKEWESDEVNKDSGNGSVFGTDSSSDQ